MSKGTDRRKHASRSSARRRVLKKTKRASRSSVALDAFSVDGFTKPAYFAVNAILTTYSSIGLPETISVLPSRYTRLHKNPCGTDSLPSVLELWWPQERLLLTRSASLVSTIGADQRS